MSIHGKIHELHGALGTNSQPVAEQRRVAQPRTKQTHTNTCIHTHKLTIPAGRVSLSPVSATFVACLALESRSHFDAYCSH